jgi:hypothetical protein
MSKPLVVTIPHRLGKGEAVRRLKTGFGTVRTKFGHLVSLQEEAWVGDELTFRVRALGQSANGTILVEETNVRLELHLSWLLARLAETISKAVRKEGRLMLEDKSKS